MDAEFSDPAGPSRSFPQGGFGSPRDPNGGHSPFPSGGPPFDISQWYPQHQGCRRYFLDQAQHQVAVQTLAAFVNILLPYQTRTPILSSKPPSPISAARPLGLTVPPQIGPSAPSFSNINPTANNVAVSLIPYIRRLVATGFDQPEILHGFFGNDWKLGVGPMHEMERRNYLFAAKSGSWLEVKTEYDMSEGQTVPFLKPLQNATEAEISTADNQWSDWLAMQDWMVGPRAPDTVNQSSRAQSPSIKREPQG
jgi:hypothetical protein